jgi:hypothetical protein
MYGWYGVNGHLVSIYQAQRLYVTLSTHDQQIMAINLYLASILSATFTLRSYFQSIGKATGCHYTYRH